MQKRLNQLFSCTLCNRSFNTNGADFTKPIDGVTFGEGFAVWCLDKFGDIYKTRFPKKNLGDRIVTCPYCESIHVKNF